MSEFSFPVSKNSKDRFEVLYEVFSNNDTREFLLTEICDLGDNGKEYNRLNESEISRFNTILSFLNPVNTKSSEETLFNLIQTIREYLEMLFKNYEKESQIFTNQKERNPTRDLSEVENRLNLKIHHINNVNNGDWIEKLIALENIIILIYNYLLEYKTNKRLQPESKKNLKNDIEFFLNLLDEIHKSMQVVDSNFWNVGGGYNKKLTLIKTIKQLFTS